MMGLDCPVALHVCAWQLFLLRPQQQRVRRLYGATATSRPPHAATRARPTPCPRPARQTAPGKASVPRPTKKARRHPPKKTLRDSALTCPLAQAAQLFDASSYPRPGGQPHRQLRWSLVGYSGVTNAALATGVPRGPLTFQVSGHARSQLVP